jgi:hypothetical protein
MKPKNNPDPAIGLNSTFMRLSTGEATISKVIAKRDAIRAAAIAKETSGVRRRREFTERTDPFSGNHCR